MPDEFATKINTEFENAYGELPWFVRRFSKRKDIARVLYAQGRIDGIKANREFVQDVVRKSELDRFEALSIGGFLVDYSGGRKDAR